MRRTPFRLVIAAALAIASWPSAGADWSRYRGPNGTGIAAGPTQVPSEVGRGKNVAWTTALPPGNSSPIVVGNRVIVTAHEGDQRLVICLNAATGKELWRASTRKLRDELSHPQNGPTTPSPASDGKSVFVFFPDIGLIGFSLSGKELWRVPLGPFSSIQGMAASPIVENGKVILVIDQPDDSWVLAFDAKTGKQRWRASSRLGFLGGYSTPSIYKPASGPAQLIVAAGPDLTAYQLDTGEKIWWGASYLYGPAGLPLVAGDSIYVLEPGDQEPPVFKSLLNYDSDKDGAISLRELEGPDIQNRIWYRIFRSLDKNLGNGDGVVTEEEWAKSWQATDTAGGLMAVKMGTAGALQPDAVRWRVKKGIPYVTSALLYQDALYIVRNGGILTTYNPATGEIIKQARLTDATGEYYASPVAADGKVYLVSLDGKVSVVKSGPQWEVLSSGDLEEQVVATPAIAANRIFIRTAKTIYCFAVSPASAVGKN